MVAIGHKAVFETDLQTQVGTTFATKLTLSSADVTANATYLVLCYAQVAAGSAQFQLRARLGHGATPTIFTGSTITLEPAGSQSLSQFHNYFYMTKWVVGGSAEDLVFQLATRGLFEIAFADSIVIFILRLDDSNANMSENTDWFFTEDTSSVTHTIAFVGFASVAPFVTSGEKWLVIANPSYAVNSTTRSAQYHIKMSGPEQTDETIPEFLQEGENTSEVLTWPLVRVYDTLSTGLVTFAVEGRDDTTGGNVHSSSRIFAMRLNAFKDVASDWQPATLSGAIDTDITVATTAITPVQTIADFLILGTARPEAAGRSFLGLRMKLSVKEGGTVTPTGADLNFVVTPYDNTDRNPAAALAVPNLSAANHTLTLVSQQTGVGGFAVSQRSLLMLSMELVGGAPPVITVDPTPVTIPLVMPVPTVTLGTKTVSPSPATIPLVVPDPTVTKGVKTVSPTAVAIPLAVPNPTVTFGAKTITPDPVLIPVLVPDPTVDFGGVAITVNPTPVAILLVVPNPTVTFGTKTVSPTPVTIPLAVPDPVVTPAKTVSPTAVAIPLVMPAPNVIRGTKTVTPTPVTIPILIPVPDIQIAGAESFEFFGEAIWEVATADYPTGAVFKCIWVIQADSVSGEPAIAQLVDIASGIPIVLSKVTTTAAVPTFIVSSAFTLNAGRQKYRPQIGGIAGVGGEYTMFVCTPQITSS